MEYRGCHEYFVTVNNSRLSNSCKVSNIKDAMRVYTAFTELKDVLYPNFVVDIVDGETGEVLLSSDYDV